MYVTHMKYLLRFIETLSMMFVAAVTRFVKLFLLEYWPSRGWRALRHINAFRYSLASEDWSSQEEEETVERLLLPNIVGQLLRGNIVSVRLDVALFLRIADRREQIGDLVRVHARSGNLDWASPVEVVVAQGEGELLEFDLRQARLVERHVEVSGPHAALSALDGNEEEVKLAIGAVVG